METKLKPKTVPVKKVTKNSPSAGASSKASNGRDLMANAKAKLILGTYAGMRIAKIRNR